MIMEGDDILMYFILLYLFGSLFVGCCLNSLWRWLRR